MLSYRTSQFVRDRIYELNFNMRGAPFMLKRIISLLLAAVLMVFMLPLSAWAEDHTAGGTLPEETVLETVVEERT